MNTPTAGSGDDTRTSTRTPSSGNPAKGFQERPWRAQEDGEGGRGPGVGVVLAQDAAAAGQDVFVQLPGRLVLAQLEQRAGEDEGGGQGVGVVLAQDAAAAGQGVFAQLPGRLALADRTQADGQAVGGGQRVGVVLAQDAGNSNPQPSDP